MLPGTIAISLKTSKQARAAPTLNPLQPNLRPAPTQGGGGLATRGEDERGTRQ